MIYEIGQVITNAFEIDQISVYDKYAEIILKDSDSKITGILKDNVDLFTKTYSIGEKVICKGKIRKRRKYNCLDIIYIQKNTIETPAITDKFNVEGYITRFNELVESVVDQEYRNVLDSCFNDDIKELFFTYPAAKKNHHNYTHGLLQHSIEVVDISLMLSNYFKGIDNDLLICAGILHDIGKLKSYEMDESQTLINKTDWEQLLGHLPMSTIFLSKIMPADTSSQKAMLLYHMILSHHGELEYGSPIVCKTKEAIILHKADDISSLIHHIDSLTFTKNWSELDNKTSYQRSWYKP